MKFALIYESANGIITMTPRSDYQVMQIDGLEQVAADAQIKRYSRIAGQKTLFKNPEPRTLTITGRINAGSQRRFRTDNLSSVFDNTVEGTLKLNMYGKLRRIKCYPDTVAFGEVDRNNKLPFVITLTCDDPYFKDWEDIELSLFSRVDNLIDGMEFPRVFSYLYTKGNAVNYGMVNVEPIIIIEAGTPTEDAPETGILIENETTGKQILLNYIPVENEVITINIPERKIVSNLNSDITRYKPLQYLLSEFVFVKGGNMINFTNYDTGQPLTASAIYSNLYTEAVY